MDRPVWRFFVQWAEYFSMILTLSYTRICWASAVGSTREARPAVKEVPETASWPQEAQTANWVAYLYSSSVRLAMPRTSSA